MNKKLNKKNIKKILDFFYDKKITNDLKNDTRRKK